MPTLLFSDFGLVKGRGFDSWRRIGTAMQAVKVYNLRDIDELVFLDISATRRGTGPDFETVDELADECFMPLTVGGGVRSLDDVRHLLRAGADKVVINSAAVDNPLLVAAVAADFGSQCVVVSIDARRHEDGSHEVFTHSGTEGTGQDPVALAQRMAAEGAGEILLTSIERDGTMTGYDLHLVAAVSAAVDIPVIASGGASGPDDMIAAVNDAGASSVAAASIFHFTELTPGEAKDKMAAAGIPVRAPYRP